MAIHTAPESRSGYATFTSGDDHTTGAHIDSNGNPCIVRSGTTVQTWVSGSVTQCVHKTNVTASSSGTGVKGSIANPLGVTAILNRVVIRLDTAQGGTCTWDIKESLSDVTTGGDTLFDGINGNAAANTIYDTLNATDIGTNGVTRARVVGSAGGIVFTVATGNGNACILTVTSYWTSA